MFERKQHIENRRAAVTKKLSARIQDLKSKGVGDRQVQRDPKIKHYQAEIRQANRQLAQIAGEQLLNTRKAEIKSQKQAAPKAQRPKAKRSGSEPSRRKLKRELKLAAAGEEAGE